jgi:hypothetical protein
VGSKIVAMVTDCLKAYIHYECIELPKKWQPLWVSTQETETGVGSETDEVIRE